MKKTILLTLSLLFILNMYGQYPIQNDSVKIRGVYKSFAEFQNNSPSLHFEFTLEEKSTGSGAMGAGEKLLQYKMEVSKDKKSQLDNVWGFCDGKEVYRRDVNNTWFLVFSPISELNTYPVYQGIQYSFSNGSNTIVFYVIDIQNGTETTLTTSMIKKLLKKSAPELFDKFRKESSKKEKLYKYYVQYKTIKQ